LVVVILVMLTVC